MDSDSDDSDGFFRARVRVPFGGKNKRPSLSTSFSSCDDNDSDTDAVSSPKKSRISDIRATFGSNLRDYDSDSDDDVEVVGISAAKNSRQSSQSRDAPPKQQVAIEIDDSSSDEEGPGMRVPLPISRQTAGSALKALQQARLARYNLSSAHNFRAADVVADVPTRPTTVRPAQRAIKPSIDYGPSIRLKLSTTEIASGVATGKITDDYMNIGAREPFRKLLDRYRHAKALDESSRVIFFRRKDRLNLTKTPDALDLKEDDVILVEAPPPKNGPNKVSPTAAQPKADLGQRLSLCLRDTSGNQCIVVTRAKVPLSSVVEKFKKQRSDISKNAKVDLLFDGEAMSLSSTPESHELEDEDLIDVKIR